MSKLIIILGPSASGKSRLVQAIKEQSNTPVIGKDDIKEILYETIGVGDLELSKKQGMASFDILFAVLEQFAKTDSTVITESNFRPQHVKKFKQLRFNEVAQILVVADEEILVERFKARAEAERHPGHKDNERGTGEEFRQVAKESSQFLDLPGKKLKIDTSDGDFNTYCSTVLEFIKKP